MLVATPATMATLQLSQQMAEAGADAVMVVTPCYYKTNLTSEALTAHYTKVCGTQTHSHYTKLV